MADKFYRLISALINICPEPLRELFLHNAKADTKPGVPYTTLDAYLAKKRPTIQSMKSRRKLRDDQFDLLYPPSLGTADESKWDITLLAVLILELFGTNIPNQMQFFIKDIRDVRNNLHHISNTSNMSHSTFAQMWDRLEIATLTLAKHVHGSHYENTIKERFKKALVSNMPDLGNTLCVWFTEKITMEKRVDEMKEKMDKMQEKMDKMQEKINEISEDTRGTKREITKTTDILESASMVKPGPAGKPNRRLRTVDKILKKMQDDFERTMNTELQENFTAPTEVDKIKSKLRDNRFVIVAGHNKSFYRTAALSAVRDIDYQENRCVQMNTPSDWNHIDAEDVDFVLCYDPFGRDTYDHKKSKGMADIFSSIQYTMNERDGKELVVMLITDIAVLNECKEKHYHELLEEVVTVYDSTTVTHPADLTVASCAAKYAQSSSTISQNLIEHTQLYLQHHKVSSRQVEPSILSEAKANFKMHKAVVLVGPRRSGKTSLAVALAASYQPSQVLLLAYPEEVQHVNVDNTNLVLVEDFAGKYSFNQNQTENWYRTFDKLDIMKTAGKLNLVITCDKGKLEKCRKRIATHPILEHVVDLTGRSIPVKQEIITTDVDKSQSGTEVTDISSDESSPGDWESPVNLSAPKYQFVNAFISLGNITGDKSIICTTLCLAKDESLYVAARSLSDGCYYLIHQNVDRHITGRHPVKDGIRHMCSTRTGEIVAISNGLINRNQLIRVYSITGSGVETKEMEHLEKSCFCKAVSCDDDDQIYMIFTNGKIKLYEIHNMRLGVKAEYTVQLPTNKLSRCNVSYKGHIFINNNEKLYYENFRTNSKSETAHTWSVKCTICTASEEPYSVFVSCNNRILQYNTSCEMISDISQPVNMGVTHMVFDKTRSRLICYNDLDNKIYEIYI